MIEFLVLYLIFSFLFGTIIGSFVNVLAIELEPNVFSQKTKKSFWSRINRRSICPKCKKKLEFFELVPILSFIFLRAKCSGCSNKISFRYFFVEIFSGLVFAGLFYFLFQKYFLIVNGFMITEFFYWTLILVGLIVIFLFDFKHKVIPNIVIFPLFFLAVFYSIFNFQTFSFQFVEFFPDLVRSVFFAFPFFALWFLSKGRAIGFADWKLILVLSFFMVDYWQNLFFVFASFWVGAIYSLPLVFFKKKISMKSEVPFGPFIILAFLIVLFFNLSYFSFLNFF